MKHRKFLYIIFFFVGLTLFVFSLLPFFRAFTPDTFWVMTVFGFFLTSLSMFGLLYKPKEKTKLTSRYARKDNLVSDAERSFLLTLRQVEPDKYEVLPQIALVSVIDKKTNTSYRNELFRICDYCFVDKDTFEPLLLVELNDSSHKRADRRERDEKVAAICADAGLPLVTFRTDDDLSYSAVKRTVLRAIIK